MNYKAYSIKDFAKIMDVHPNTIRKCIKETKIAAFRIGTGKKASWRILESEIERLLSYDLKQVIDRLVEEKVKENMEK
jgi:DNA-binding transcriptional regulator YhcF (GntR family)